jgi:hypothetical protein
MRTSDIANGGLFVLEVATYGWEVMDICLLVK